MFVLHRLFEKGQIQPQSPLTMGRAGKYAGGGIKLQVAAADLMVVWGVRLYLMRDI